MEDKEIGKIKCNSPQGKNRDKELITYFDSVFTKENTNQIPELLDDARFGEREELREIDISREMVLGKLLGSKVDKSPGPDNLHPRVLKEGALEIVDALVVIFQDSIDSGT
eukprot:g19213.t1